MTDRERALLKFRFMDIEADGRFMDGDPAEVEERRLEEQEENEFRFLSFGP